MPSVHPAAFGALSLVPPVQAANLDATLRRQQAATAGKAPAGKPGTAAAAAAAATAPEPQSPLVRVTPAALAAAAGEVEQQCQLAADLAALFADPQHPPDLEFGCMAAVHVPPGDAVGGSSSGSGGTGAQSLLRVDLAAAGSAVSRRRESMGPGQRYLLVSRALAESLADALSVEARLALLEALPEGRFAGRAAVQAAAEAVRSLRRRQAQGKQRTAGRTSSGFIIPKSL